MLNYKWFLLLEKIDYTMFFDLKHSYEADMFYQNVGFMKIPFILVLMLIAIMIVRNFPLDINVTS
jgi:hypothetical protein